MVSLRGCCLWCWTLMLPVPTHPTELHGSMSWFFIYIDVMFPHSDVDVMFPQSYVWIYQTIQILLYSHLSFCMEANEWKEKKKEAITFYLSVLSNTSWVNPNKVQRQQNSAETCITSPLTGDAAVHVTGKDGCLTFFIFADDFFFFNTSFKLKTV